MASSSLSLSSAPCSSCVVGTLPDLLKRAMTQGRHGGITAYLATELPHNQQSSKDGCQVRTGNACASAESPHLSAIDATAAAEALPSDPHQQEKSPATLCSSRITAMRYYMKPDTWTQTLLSHEGEPARESRTAGEVPYSGSATTGGVTSSDPRGCNSDVHVHHQATPSLLSIASSVVTATATEEASSLSAASSPLHGLPLHQLIEQHSALVRRLVQVLAPQRQTIPHVIRELCTTRVTSPSSGVVSRVCVLPSTDSSNAEPMQYTERDVAAAVEQLTSSHPRQPRLRELKSDGYLLMNLEGFVDGKTRHKAVNRAYPALALHWPASAQQMDAMERYVDRDVVLDTRKRHPELSGEGSDKKQGQKRDRSRSSTSSNASGAEEDGAHKARVTDCTSAPPSPPLGMTASPKRTAQTSSSRRFFQSLRDSASARLLQAATTLTQSSASTADVSSDAATLGPLPITKEEDVEVLRCQYDALAAAESVLEKQLRAYSDTVQELRGCLQRDLSNYLHLHALGVL
ncbi:hypothetical protein CGC20_1990 [Leishmania donovani]|uniref:Uncharacterized protein n=1 Tax=Leishmania donovani TaxID=5661 RepID=A0A504XPS7_LEIDO|nr:hypothetical protein CGC20_1990 [Leishmania donovani]